MCRPVFVKNSQPVLDITNGRHPCIIPQLGGDVIPNDLTLGSSNNKEAPPVMVLTGPNMGGKSTLLRQACLTVIMAQLGCYVPAEACTLTPVDRIFTVKARL
jgi:DNA mismatch repair protein MSH6